MFDRQCDEGPNEVSKVVAGVEMGSAEGARGINWAS